MHKIDLKTEEELRIMAEGGKKLSRVKKALARAVKPGVSAWDIEVLARKLIKEEGAEGSFDKVPNYSYVTCINVNDGVVHGIPKKETIFKEGDVLSIDVGIYYRGFHTDTAVSVCLTKDTEKQQFLAAGRKAMEAGIAQVKRGKRIGDISEAIEKTLLSYNLTPVWALTGHGVGRELHEEPSIPCYRANDSTQELIIGTGMALAVEVMFTTGKGEIKQDTDGWTLRTKDGKIAGLWEETVTVTSDGPFVVTK